MAVTKENPEVIDVQRAYRIERYEELRFTPKESGQLADAKDSNGFPVSWHFVRRAINNGLSHKQAVDLLT